MNDRELLEAAAKAAGYKILWDDISVGIAIEGYGLWNPLESDADAFCLMVDLKMKIQSIGTREKVRRAIVSVAAQMVKT